MSKAPSAPAIAPGPLRGLLLSYKSDELMKATNL
jgi:hypothetical protein